MVEFKKNYLCNYYNMQHVHLTLRQAMIEAEYRMGCENMDLVYINVYNVTDQDQEIDTELEELRTEEEPPIREETKEETKPLP